MLYIMSKMKPKLITIREDQDEWIREHKSVNFSGFIQEKLDELIKRDGEIPFFEVREKKEKYGNNRKRDI